MNRHFFVQTYDKVRIRIMVTRNARFKVVNKVVNKKWRERMMRKKMRIHDWNICLIILRIRGN